MFAHVDYKLAVKCCNMRGPPRKSICFVLYRKQSIRGLFMSMRLPSKRISRCCRNGLFLKWMKTPEISFSSRTELQILGTGAFSVFWTNPYPYDGRLHREWRPVDSDLSPEISWSPNLRLLLVGIHKSSSLCTTSTNNFGQPKDYIRAAVNSLT
jgi:hypothetical protein